MPVRLTIRRGLLATGAGVLAATLTVAGCSSSKSTGGSSSGTTSGKGSIPTQQTDKTLAAMVPANLRSAGALTIASDASYPPNEFLATNNTTVIGWDVELATAIAQTLGLKPQITNVKFDNIIPGIQAGRYDLGVSSFTDTKARQQTLDFVTYYSDGTSLMAMKGNPEHLSTSGDVLCGKKIAVEDGTIQQADVASRSKKCQADGKPAVTVLTFENQTQANLALSSGRAQAVLADAPTNDYAVSESSGQFQIVGAPYGAAPYGIAVPKNEGQMAKAVQGALEKLISNGVYHKILAQWGVTDGAITTPVINGATS